VSVPDAAAAEQRTTPAELFWDLVFVFAVTQVTTLLYEDLSWTGFGRAMLVLALVWWAWSAFVWAMNAHDPNEPPIRGVLFVAMILTFIVALAVPTAFGADATTFALAYAGVRLLHLGLYVHASRRGHASLAAIAGFAVTVGIGMALLIVGSRIGDPARTCLWLAAVAIDYAGPAWLTRERLRGIQRIAVGHFAERYSLFIIICLGESMIAIGVGAAGRDLDAELVAGVALALLVTIGLWWTYFDRVAGEAEDKLAAHEEPVLAAADAYSYLHLLLVSGIIVSAIGLKAAVGHAAEPLSEGARLALCGGVALYLGGHVAFGLRLAGELGVDTAVAAVGSGVVFIVAADSPAWATVGMIAAVLALLAVFEHRLGAAADPGRIGVAFARVDAERSRSAGSKRRDGAEAAQQADRGRERARANGGAAPSPP
jgi:low temperature requirement protein LtrA